MVFEKYGSTNEVSSIIRNIIGGTNSEIQVYSRIIYTLMVVNYNSTYYV